MQTVELEFPQTKKVGILRKFISARASFKIYASHHYGKYMESHKKINIKCLSSYLHSVYVFCTYNCILGYELFSVCCNWSTQRIHTQFMFQNFFYKVEAIGKVFARTFYFSFKGQSQFLHQQLNLTFSSDTSFSLHFSRPPTL